MRFEIRIALIYLVTGIVWIVASDAVVASLFGNIPDLLIVVQANKGMAYVVATSCLLYGLVRFDLKRRQQQETKFQLLFAKNPNPVWVYDATSLRFLEVNERAIETYGYSRAEFLQMTIKDIRTPAEILKLMNILAQPRTEPFRTLEWQHITQDGTLLDVELTSQQLEYEGQLAVLVVMRDITERKQLEVERITNEALQAELKREQEAHATRSRFFSMVSHEFRTPLATITSAASLLQRYDDGRLSAEKRSGYYAKILSQAYLLSDQLDEMLLLLRTEMSSANYQPQPHDIVKLCNEVVETISSSTTTPRTIEFKTSHDVLVMDMDYKLMWRILTNLLSNAVKYSPEEKSVHLALDINNQQVEICVQDEGIGIPPEELENLFEPFFRANNADSIQGTGLGLTIVKQAVELHGGEISVQSVIGTGTIFYVKLPLQQPYIYEIKQSE